MSTVRPTWRALLEQSARHWTESEAARHAQNEAGRYLWLGAKAAIEAWNPRTDPTAERLYWRTLAILGEERKGSASKIKRVALASREQRLDLDGYKSLNAAYKAAQGPNDSRVTKILSAYDNEYITASEALTLVRQHTSR